MFRFDIDSISEEIVKKYELEEGKGNELKTNIIFLIILLLPLENFKQFVIKELGLTYEKAIGLIGDVEKMLLTPIENKIEDFENERKLIREIEAREKNNAEVPLPPYATETTKIEPEKIETPKTEENLYENSGIEMIEEVKPDTIETPETSTEGYREDGNNILGNSGINVVEEIPIKKDEIIPETETDKILIENIEHPENITENILMNKLKGGSISNTIISDHSLPKMSSDK
jgi:hypothetical protein